MRGGRKSVGFVFVGNHFGTKVVKNHVLGGESRIQAGGLSERDADDVGLDSCAYLGGLIEANILEDSEGGGSLGVEHNPVISSRTRAGPT